MTPNLSALLGAIDTAQQSVLLAVAAKESAAKLADDAAQRHKDAYAAVEKAMSDLQAASTICISIPTASSGSKTSPTAPERISS